VGWKLSTSPRTQRARVRRVHVGGGLRHLFWFDTVKWLQRLKLPASLGAGEP
jgi:hypothetical protein